MTAVIVDNAERNPPGGCQESPGPEAGAYGPPPIDRPNPARGQRRAVIELENVSKTFGDFRAVNNLSLRVPEQTIAGFIGPNGSGKTTTLRMIMGIYHPDEGSGAIRTFGQVSTGVASDRIGYLPEDRGLYKRMKVVDILRFYAERKGCTHVKQDVAFWLEKMQLTDAAHKRVEELSKGMAQKVQFIATVINRPSLIILDEPFSGLDPINTEVLRDAVLGLRREGATVIFSTHDMAVAERMCDFIVMICRGDKVLDGTLDSIQQKYGADTIRVRIENPDTALGGLPGVKHVIDFGGIQELRMESGYDARAVLRELLRHTTVWHFEVTRPSLQDIFVRIAGPQEAEAAHA